MSELKTYSELITLPTLEERINYLRLDGLIGVETFGFDRVFNQAFYNSSEWQSVRNYVITRDFGHELAMPDRIYEIAGSIYVHHMNPLCLKDLELHSDKLLDPEFLVCSSYNVHKVIHFGGEINLPYELTIRRPNDTCPWKTEGVKIQNGIK